MAMKARKGKIPQEGVKAQSPMVVVWWAWSQTV